MSTLRKSLAQRPNRRLIQKENSMNYQLKPEIEKDPNQDLIDLTMEKTAEMLETFLQIRVKSSNSSQTVLVARPAFHCDQHGHNSTHDKSGCRVLNDRRNSVEATIPGERILVEIIMTENRR
jgi:hypothetical protein